MTRTLQVRYASDMSISTCFGNFEIIKPGTFRLGNERAFASYGGAIKQEHGHARPSHEVRITKRLGFLSTPMTCSGFRGFVEDAPQRFGAAVLKWKEYSDPDGAYALSDEIDHPKPSQTRELPLRNFLTDPSNASLPAIGINHDDAVAFCEYASGELGMKVRLPTEAEWEYAYRAGTQTIYYFGDDTRLVPNHAWCCVNSGIRPHPVASFPPNPWGLFDMAGNVWEWCADRYSTTFYSSESVEDPRCVDASREPFVIRGSGALNKAETCRASHRFGLPPHVRSQFLSFRPVIELP